MFARTVVMRLRATRVVMAVSPYALFLKSTTGTLTGLTLQARGRALAKQWKSLPAAEKAKFVSASKKHPAFPKRGPRKPHAFAKFIRANYASVKRLPQLKRLGALAKKWHARK